MKILIILCLLISGVAHAQTTGYFRYDSTRLEKVGGNNELIILNATRNVPGFLYNKGNGRTEFRPALSKVRPPLYISGDTIVLNLADPNNDGYVAAADWSRFDSAAKRWKDTTMGGINYITHRDKFPYFRGFYTSNGAFGSSIVSGVEYPNFMIGPAFQSVAIGARGLAARYKAGLATGLELTAVGEYALGSATTAANGVAIGKAAGYDVTTATNFLYLGRNVVGAATVSDTFSVMHWLMGASGRLWASIHPADGDSSLRIPTTAMLQRAISAKVSAGGGSSAVTPVMELVSTNTTITEPTNHVSKTYIANPLGADIVMSPPVSPTEGQIIVIYLLKIDPTGSVTINTAVGDRTLTTNGTSYTLQWSNTFFNYIIIGGS